MNDETFICLNWEDDDITDSIELQDTYLDTSIRYYYID